MKNVDPKTLSKTLNCSVDSIDIMMSTFKQFGEIDFVFLFGSYAKKCAKKMSDLDMAVHGELSLLDVGYITTECESILKRKVDVVLINNAYRKNALFAFQAVSNTVPLLIPDEKLFVEFKKKAMLYYFDQKHLFDNNRNSISDRIQKGTFGERNYA